MKISFCLRHFAFATVLASFTLPSTWHNSLAFFDDYDENVIAIRYGVLSDEDIALYKKIQSLQSKERWQDADKTISKLNNKILMGYILGQRYLESATWKTKSKETIAWMEQYSDLPFAGKMYDLGKQKGANFTIKKPKDVDKIPSGSCSSYTLSNPIDLIKGKKFSNLPPEKRAIAQKTMGTIVSAINHGKTLIAYNFINSKEAQTLFTPHEIDAAKTALAYLYFTELHDDKALEIIEPAIRRSGEFLPMGQWVAGLIYWRTGNFEKAFEAFASAAKNPKTKPVLRSAAAYWAARANYKNGHYFSTREWFELAAKLPTYFYGILANRELGSGIEYEWEKPEDSDGDETIVVKKTPVQRAIALYQIGLSKRGDEELLKYYARSSDTIKNGLIDLSEKNNLKELSQVMISLSGKISASKGNYPAPHWEPLSGWKVDKSLVYAFVRQESCFNNNAVSKAGAMGLMQIMPSTAKAVCKSINLEYSTKRLSEPAYNLEIGQTYIDKLLQNPLINGNLIFLAVAYNSGPNNLRRWEKRMNYQEDPLLFIESIPSKETRGFVQKILSNYWVYSSLFGNNLNSLDEILNGKWPMYEF